MSGKKGLFNLIGIIGKPHGLKGYVYVRMFTDYPDSIIKNSSLYLSESLTEAIIIEDILNLTGSGGPRTVFKFFGTNNRSEAESLRGKSLYKEFSGQKVLEEDTYWVEDLLDCSVYNENNVLLGHVKEIENYKSNDNLLVEPVKRNVNNKNDTTTEGSDKNLIIIPMIEEYLKEIDIKNKKIILVKLPEYI